MRKSTTISLKNQVELLRDEWELNTVQETVLEATEAVMQKQPEKDWSKDLLVSAVTNWLRRWSDETVALSSIEETLNILNWK